MYLEKEADHQERSTIKDPDLVPRINIEKKKEIEKEIAKEVIETVVGTEIGIEIESIRKEEIDLDLAPTLRDDQRVQAPLNKEEVEEVRFKVHVI